MFSCFLAMVIKGNKFPFCAITPRQIVKEDFALCILHVNGHYLLFKEDLWRLRHIFPVGQKWMNNIVCITEM